MFLLIVMYGLKSRKVWTAVFNRNRKVNHTMPLSHPKDFTRRPRDNYINWHRHTSITHGHLMSREEPPSCCTCGEQLTLSIKHKPTECRNLQLCRKERNSILRPTQRNSFPRNPFSSIELLWGMKIIALNFYIPYVRQNSVHEKVKLFKVHIQELKNVWSNSLVSCTTNRIQRYVYGYLLSNISTK